MNGALIPQLACNPAVFYHGHHSMLASRVVRGPDDMHGTLRQHVASPNLSKQTQTPKPCKMMSMLRALQLLQGRRMQPAYPP